MKLFKLVNNNIVLNIDEIILVKEFNALLKRDKSHNKSRAFEEFKYIYFVYDYSSPYVQKGYGEVILKAKALDNCEITIEEDDLVKSAIDVYKDLQDSLELRIYLNLIKSFDITDKIIDKIREDITLKLSEDSSVDNINSLVSSLKTLLTLANDIPDKLESLKKCENLIKKQQESQGLARNNTVITDSMIPKS